MISIFLLCIFTIATSGAIVKMHYCGDMLESWNISMQNAVNALDGCCDTVDDGCAENKSESNCCTDDFIALKIQQDYSNPYTSLNLPGFSAFTLPEINYSSYDWRLLEFINETHNYYESATHIIGLWQNIPLYQLFECKKIFDEAIV